MLAFYALGLHKISKLCLTRKKGNPFFFYCIHKYVVFYGTQFPVSWLAVGTRLFFGYQCTHSVKLAFHRGRQEYVEFYHQPPGLCFHGMLFRYIQLFLGAIAFEKRLLVLSHPSVCPYACIRAIYTGQTLVEFRTLDLYLIFVPNISQYFPISVQIA